MNELIATVNSAYSVTSHWKKIFLCLKITAEADCLVGSYSDGWGECLVVRFWWKERK